MIQRPVSSGLNTHVFSYRTDWDASVDTPLLAAGRFIGTRLEKTLIAEISIEIQKEEDMAAKKRTDSSKAKKAKKVKAEANDTKAKTPQMLNSISITRRIERNAHSEIWAADGVLADGTIRYGVGQVAIIYGGLVSLCGGISGSYELAWNEKEMEKVFHKLICDLCVVEASVFFTWSSGTLEITYAQDAE